MGKQYKLNLQLERKIMLMQKCRDCGCSQCKPCLDEDTGLTCSWLESDLCSFCAIESGDLEAQLTDEPAIALYSEAEADAYILATRSMRAGV